MEGTTGLLKNTQGISYVQTRQNRAKSIQQTRQAVQKMTQDYKPIYPKKHQAMQQVLHLVSRGGYAYWTGGTVPGKKLMAFVEKMRDRYAVDRTESQRRRARERGDANTQLVIYPLKREKRPQSDDFAFFMLVDRDAPESLVWQLERLQSVFKRRIHTPTAQKGPEARLDMAHGS